MANKQLAGYIQEQLRKGYNAAAIRSYLLKYGYSAKDIDSALKEAYSPEVRHVIHFSPATLISIAGIFVFLVAAVFGFMAFFGDKEAETLLDMNLESVKTSVSVGNQITFISEIDNLGSSKRYDVEIKYELISSRTNKVVTFKEETRAIETKGSKQISIGIPPDAPPGDYVLRAIATYDGKRAVATLPVKIAASASEDVPGETPAEETPEEIPEEIIEEEPADEPIDEAEEPQIPSGEAQSALSTFETLEKVENIAKQDRSGAEEMCNGLQLQTSKDLCFNKLAEVLGDRSYCGKIAEERTRDVCLSNVAKIIGSHAVCEDISKESRKDSCYMNFVVEKKDYSVCEKVVNQYLRQSCESLRQLSKLNITDVSYYESLISQSLVEFV